MCDIYPYKQVEWYNKKEKTIVSNKKFKSTSKLNDHVKIDKEQVETFL